MAVTGVKSIEQLVQRNRYSLFWEIEDGPWSFAETRPGKVPSLNRGVEHDFIFASRPVNRRRGHDLRETPNSCITRQQSLFGLGVRLLFTKGLAATLLVDRKSTRLNSSHWE